MIKEYLEAFERITEHLDLEDEYSYKQLFEDEKIIKQALQRLEAIDNSNYSETLKSLERLDIMNFYRSIDVYVPEIKRNVSRTQYLDNTNEFSIIKQALLKAQEQEKALSIIKEKAVNILSLKFAIKKNSLELYNNSIPAIFKYLWLTQEEFDTVKRWC